MFAQKPIFVHLAQKTWVVRYIREGKLAAVVDRKDAKYLADIFMNLLIYEKERFALIKNAREIVERDRNLSTIQASFLELVQSLYKNID